MKRMRMSFLGVLLAAVMGVVVAGCKPLSEGRFVYESRPLQNAIDTTELPPRKDPQTGLTRVGFDVKNRSSRPIHLEYRVEFLEDGRQVDTTAWTYLYVGSFGVEQATVISPRREFDDYRFSIRPTPARR